MQKLYGNDAVSGIVTHEDEWICYCCNKNRLEKLNCKDDIYNKILEVIKQYSISEKINGNMKKYATIKIEEINKQI